MINHIKIIQEISSIVLCFCRARMKGCIQQLAFFALSHQARLRCEYWLLIVPNILLRLTKRSAHIINVTVGTLITATTDTVMTENGSSGYSRALSFHTLISCVFQSDLLLLLYHSRPAWSILLHNYCRGLLHSEQHLTTL